MELRKRPEYVLEVLADPTCVKDIVRGILHTIFFHRYFPSMRPSTLEVLDLTLPVVADPELETLIETRVGQLVRQLSSTSSLSGGSRGELGVRFFEKRRRKASGLGGWLTGTGRSEEEVCWEVWKLKITLTTPRTESERMTLLRAEGPALQRTAMSIVKIVNRDKDHIPPITTSETNPFPYDILLNPRAEYDGKTVSRSVAESKADIEQGLSSSNDEAPEPAARDSSYQQEQLEMLKRTIEHVHEVDD